MNARGRQFSRSVPGVIAGIVGTCRGQVPDLKVVYSGPPRTNGKTIYVGDLPLNADEDLIDMLWGHLLHEVGHIVCTAFQTANVVLANQTALFKGTHNAIEDVYLERHIISHFRGAHRWLAKSLAVMQAKGHLKTHPKSGGAAVSDYPLFWGSVKVNGFSVLAPFLGAYREALVQHLGENGVVRLEGLLESRLATVNSTAQALDLTSEYLDLVREIEDEEEQDESNDSDDTDESSDDSGDDGDSSSDSDPSGSSADPSDQDADATSVFDDQHDSDLETSPVDTAAALEEAGNDQAHENAARGDFLTAGDACEFTGHQGRPGTGNIDRFHTLSREVGGVVSSLANRLATLMAQAMSSKKTLGHRGKRINSARVGRVFRGDGRIYNRRTVSQVPNPCVSVVVDLSGSMGGAGEQMASKTLIALTEALNKARIPFEVTTFGRDFWVAKGFDEPYGPNRAYIGGLDEAVSGSTPLGEAMHEAAMRLVRRSEKRRILLCLTDGEPNDGSLVRDVDEKLRNAGVDVLGIGICHSAVTNLFAQSAVVHDLNDLGPQLLAELTPRLLAKAS